MDREIGDADPIEAGVTPASEDVAADRAAATGERKRKPTDRGEEETTPSPVEAGVTPASGNIAADTAATTEPRPTTAATAPIPAADAPASLDLNALHKLTPEELPELANKFGVFLHPARTRH